MFPLNLQLGAGWYTWSTFVLALTAFFTVLLFVITLGVGLFSGDMEVILYGFVGLGLWFLFAGAPYYTLNEARMAVNDKKWDPKAPKSE